LGYNEGQLRRENWQIRNQEKLMQYVFYGIGLGLLAVICFIVWWNEDYTDKGGD
jgi:hypothetical protein